MSERLVWGETDFGAEATLGDFASGGWVRFSLRFLATCHRRGQWRLLVEMSGSPAAWGCFDESDQPMRYYHDRGRAMAEAEAIASMLIREREQREQEA